MLHLPDNMHYECVRCGLSCSQGWEIAVDPEQAGEILARPAEALRQAGVGDPGAAVVESPWTPGRRAMRMDGHGRCCMLGADKLCGLHKLYGEQAKPRICRGFPYRFVTTPFGSFAGLSFACTGVLTEAGPPVAAGREELASMLEWHPHRRVVDVPPELAPAIPLDWEQYFALEEDLAALLDPKLGPIGERLLMQFHYAQLAGRLVRQARESAGRQTAGPEANTEPLTVLQRRARGEGSAPWAMLRQLSGRRRGSPVLRRTLLGLAYTLAGINRRREGRLCGYFSAVRGYGAFALGRGRLVVGSGRPVSLTRLLAVRFDPCHPEADALLTRFFRHRLFRKDLLGSESIQAGLQFQLLYWGLIHWHAAALAADDGADEVRLEHLREALRLVEIQHITHAQLNRLFGQLPLVRSLLDRMFEQPLYAVSMARPGSSNS